MVYVIQLASKLYDIACMTYTIAVCRVKNSWWWTEELSETHRVLFQKQIWEISASSWFYYKNLSWCTVTWTSNSVNYYLVARRNSYMPFSQTLPQGNRSRKCYLHYQMVNKKPYILHMLTNNAQLSHDSSLALVTKKKTNKYTHQAQFIFCDKTKSFFASHQATQEYRNMHCCFYNRT